MANFINAGFRKITHDAAFCASLLKNLENTLGGDEFRFMEVCGTHTMAIFQSGIRSMLPRNITHLSGPGCPVCVTDDTEVERFLDLAARPHVIIATFGDLLRVPGADGNSLKHAKARGAQVEIVYSPLDSLNLAQSNPDKEIVFLGVGFETTAPTVAATILKADALSLKNFSVLSFHKLVPPVLASLLDAPDNRVDAFLLPGHVAAVTGVSPFVFLAEKYGVPAAIAGFEPADILLALNKLAEMKKSGSIHVENVYQRVVARNGNPCARQILDNVFAITDARWRGLGLIPKSGLAMREKYEKFDAAKKFPFIPGSSQKISGCQCGKVLQGQITPLECPLFGEKCSPANPVGPCMVSTEGSCAAFYKYGEN